MAFSESLTIAETYRENMSYYNHGFLPSDSEMKTISIVYPKSNPVKIEDLKDTFEASCNWLGLNCKRGTNRK